MENDLSEKNKGLLLDIVPWVGLPERQVEEYSEGEGLGREL